MPIIYVFTQISTGKKQIMVAHSLQDAIDGIVEQYKIPKNDLEYSHCITHQQQ